MINYNVLQQYIDKLECLIVEFEYLQNDFTRWKLSNCYYEVSKLFPNVLKDLKLDNKDIYLDSIVLMNKLKLIIGEDLDKYREFLKLKKENDLKDLNIGFNKFSKQLLEIYKDNNLFEDIINQINQHIKNKDIYEIISKLEDLGDIIEKTSISIIENYQEVFNNSNIRKNLFLDILYYKCNLNKYKEQVI